MAYLQRSPLGIKFVCAKFSIIRFAGFLDFAQISIKGPASFLVRVISFLLCREVLYHVPFGIDLVGVLPHKLSGIQLPWTGTLVAVAEVLYDSEEVGNHSLKVHIYDPGHKEIGNFGTQMQVDIGDSTQMQSIVLGLKIDLAGCYTFDFELDGTHRKRRTLNVESQVGS